MLATEIETLLKDIAQEEDINNPIIKIQTGTSKGDGYMGIIKFIKISGKTNVNEDKVLNVVVKNASKSEYLRKTAPIVKSYLREIYMYNIVFPSFCSLQDGIEITNPFDSFPKCYKTSAIENQETLVLQNLKDFDYKMWDRKMPMDHSHIALVLSEYGKFHALSFVLRYKNPNLYRTFSDTLDDLFYGTEARDNFIANFINRCEKAGKIFDVSKDQESIETYNKFVNEIREFMDGILQCDEEYCVVVHGDGWTNNMMFKYDDPDNPNKPTKLCFLDFQLARMASPVVDLSYFFYVCSNEGALKDLDYYLHMYHTNLSDHLKAFGINPEEAFPYTALKSQWKKYAKFGLLIAILLIHIMLSEDDEAVDLNEAADSGKQMADAFNYDIANQEEYDKRIKAIILHFIENDFL